MEVVYASAKSRSKGKLKKESLYQKWMTKKIEPTNLGREQFIDYESRGLKPQNPDPYFLSLCEGKKWFGVQQTDIKNSYLTLEWCGWYQHWIDFKGKRWILKDLMSWHDEPPCWLFKEDYELTSEERQYLLGEVDVISGISPWS